MIIIHLLWLLFDIGPGHGEGDRAVVLASRDRKKQTFSLLLIFIDLIFTQSANCEIKYLPFFHLYINSCVRWDLHESSAAKCRERKTKNNEINQLSMERVREVFLQLAKRTEEVTNFFLSLFYENYNFVLDCSCSQHIKCHLRARDRSFLFCVFSFDSSCPSKLKRQKHPNNFS